MDVTETNRSDPELLFVVGSPRSGTTWLQLLLAQHEAVVTDKETQLFTQYVNRLEERWKEELCEAESGTTNGLTRVLTEDEFIEAIKGFSDKVFSLIRRDSPAARFVLEKSPEHTLHARTILRAYPNAWFLHIIRDPRAVSNSFRHAAEDWWADAPSGPVATTRRWRTNVDAGREIAALTRRYREVRYEELQRNGPAALCGIFEWLDLDVDLEFCQSALEACRIDKLKKGEDTEAQPWKVGEEPDGFFRSGRRDSWREELRPNQVDAVEREAGDLLENLGYEPARNSQPWRTTSVRPRLYEWLATLRQFVAEVANQLDWRLRRLQSRL